MQVVLKNDNGKLFLDELNPNEGNATEIIVPECGLFCQVEFAHIMSDKVKKILDGTESIYEQR